MGFQKWRTECWCDFEECFSVLKINVKRYRSQVFLTIIERQDKERTGSSFIKKKLCVYPRTRVWFPIWVIKGNVLNLELETVFKQNKSWSMEHTEIDLTHLRISARICLDLSMNQPSILMLRLGLNYKRKR